MTALIIFTIALSLAGTFGILLYAHAVEGQSRRNGFGMWDGDR